MRSSPGGRKIALATPCGTPWCAVTGVDAACTTAFAFMLNAMPVMQLASETWAIASGSRSCTARRRFCPIMRIARMLIESSSGSLPRLRYDSVACASASAPVAAMIALGAVSTSSGSTIATVAARLREAHTTLKCSAGSVITTTNVTSAPVPQVVGMQITGGPWRGTRSRPR